MLDEEDLVQECKQLNKKLVDFLGLPEQVPLPSPTQGSVGESGPLRAVHLSRHK